MLRVFPGDRPTETTIFEDDGETLAYQEGALRSTRVTMQPSKKTVTVTIHPAKGTYAGARDQREIEIKVPSDVDHIVVDGKKRGMGFWSGFTSTLLDAAPVSRQRSVVFHLK